MYNVDAVEPAYHSILAEYTDAVPHRRRSLANLYGEL